MAAVLAVPNNNQFPTLATVAAEANSTLQQQQFMEQQTSSSSEAVYTTLIQTYLNLLCYDNALFLAERNAASFPQSENAIYLLAYCHYRNGSPKSARSILNSRWRGRNDVATVFSNCGVANNNTNSSSAVPNNQSDSSSVVDLQLLERTRSSARYLLAKSCFDLGLYGEAEETLLLPCREAFAAAVSEGGGTVHGVKIRGGNHNEVMDAWIVHSTSAQSSGASARRSCPIPNGSAGLYLLGNICRKTNRRQRAIEYYRLSLKLDPLLWMSFEAICELGGPSGTSDEVDDPNTIFGVPAPMLSPTRQDVMASMMGHGGFMHSAMTTSVGDGVETTMENFENVQQHQQQQPLRNFHYNRYGTPSTPYSGFGKMNIGTYTNVSTAATQHDGGGVNFHGHATVSTIASRTRARLEESVLPQTNLFATTPALSTSTQLPVIRSGVDETPFPITTATTPNEDMDNNPSMTIPASAFGYADQVIERARRVVAGQTYEPSPESMNFPATQRKTRFATELTFSTTPLPLSPMSNTATVPFHAGVSTVKGEKRTLLFMNDDGGRTPTSSSRNKSPKKEERQKEETTQTKYERSNTNNDSPSSKMMAAESGGGGQKFRLDTMMSESEHVGKVLELLCGLGAAYKYLCQFRSQDALELFRELPPEQINTGWVQHQIGKAYFEMSQYPQAQRALENMRKFEPHRMKGLDILSTTLWQLKKEVELSDLAQHAVDFDRMAPEAWFVVGNCFSLQKEHETSIIFFRRSIQLNPSYTYAHTLCGHEFTSNEDFDKAISCYRDAIRVDSRHYNAWYGLGAIYFRQEKFDLAEYHFLRALDINSQSSVLHCHLGMAQHQNGKTMEALETLAGAFLLDPRNPQAHYQRATIFMTLDRPEDALLELERVRAAAPREASVHFNMGKVHKRLGQPAKAMRCFLTALDLDPKDNNLIKAAMDRLDEPDVEEEVSVF